MKQDHIERELQFEAPDLQVVERWISAQPPHAAIAIEPKSDKTQHDTYFDTADWAIYNAGYSLRLRRLPDGSEATLKALGKRLDGAQQRREINQTVSEGEGGWAENGGPVSDRVRLMTGGRALQLLFAIETHRRTYALRREDEALAVLSLDDTSVRKGEDMLHRLRRVEVEEEREGGLASAQVLVDALAQACELQAATTSKFEAGLQAAELAPEAALDFGYAELADDATAGEFAYALLRRYLRDFLRHEPGTRLGEDPEELHDMRVATRRLRAAMSTFKDVLPLRFQTLREELQWVGQSLGKVRDPDVQLEWLSGVRDGSDWQDGTAVGPLLEELAAVRVAARSDLLETLDSERYRTLVIDLVTALREGYFGQGEAGLPIRAFGAKVLKKRYKQFRRESDKLSQESEAPLYHAARIRGKRLRYSLEALQPVFGRRGTRMVAAMRSIQDLLGEFQDCSVTVVWLRDIAASPGAAWPPATLLRMGELLEQRRSRMEALRAEWPKARAKVKKRWAPLRKSMRQARRQGKGEEPEAETAAPPAVQRPFWLLQRFFRRGHDEDQS